MKNLFYILVICILAVSVFAQQWETIQAPTLPKLYSRDNVYFLNMNEGWLFGTISSISVIAHTTDGGATWTIQYNDSTNFKMYDIFFIDSNVGWIAGSAGIIWSTNDGGNTWVDQTPGFITENLLAVHAVDANNVYICGNNGTVLKTTDGGSTWQNKSVTQASSSNFYDLYVFSADTVFAVSGSNDGIVVQSTDGGSNWSVNNLPYPPGSVSSRTYNCDGIPGGTAYASGYHGNVFKSTDYGLTWTHSANMWGSLFKFIDAISATSSNSIFTGGYSWLYRSSDGGTTWDTLRYPSANNLTYIKAFDENNLILFARYGQLFKSNDGGLTFTPLLTWPNVPFSDMTATSNRLLAACKDGGEISISEDGGYTWSYPTATATKAYGSIFDLFFVDDNLGFYAGRDGLIGKTTNAGNTWEIKATSYGFGSNKSYQFIWFWNSSTGIAGGSSGILQYTNDGGETWTEGYIGDSKTLYDCYFIDTNTGIICASSGKIFRSVDSGASWTEVVDFGSMSMLDICFLDATTGFIVARDGYVFKTNDAGASWTQEAQLINLSGNNPDLLRISFVEATTGYIVGEDGSIFKSTDLGATWNQMSVPSEIEYDLSAMYWYDGNNGLAAGHNGYIIGYGISDIQEEIPISQDYRLIQNYPNPFNPETTIGFFLPRSGPVELTIYNNLGQIVCRLFQGSLSEGFHQLQWKGVNDIGLPSPSGIYYYNLKAEKFSQVRKMILLR